MSVWASVYSTKVSRAALWNGKEVLFLSTLADVVKQLLRSLSMKQGRKYDDEHSQREIQGFIDFHKLDLTEVLLPKEEFKTYPSSIL
jgi:hypothetical protein